MRGGTILKYFFAGEINMFSCVYVYFVGNRGPAGFLEIMVSILFFYENYVIFCRDFFRLFSSQFWDDHGGIF